MPLYRKMKCQQKEIPLNELKKHVSPFSRKKPVSYSDNILFGLGQKKSRTIKFGILLLTDNAYSAALYLLSTSAQLMTFQNAET
ncbi:hypothetical protein Aconfl_41160 [Algoriphagus confluentis]|uniref:Uncharacterized protein n=1 Tax=Algoriphagus confluentis TaxID=1697556 RepID=A0ABQ6PU72_9BACT|nr:hypothetical protein Aconfl_41160 [Algoriphagus confluentis]